MFGSSPAPQEVFTEKESVELNRLSDDRFWRTRKQINNTPHLYRMEQNTSHTNTSDECYCLSLFQKNRQIQSSRTKAKHFHQYVRPVGQNKDRKCFSNITPAGYCYCKFRQNKFFIQERSSLTGNYLFLIFEKSPDARPQGARRGERNAVSFLHTKKETVPNFQFDTAPFLGRYRKRERLRLRSADLLRMAAGRTVAAEAAPKITLNQPFDKNLFVLFHSKDSSALRGGQDAGRQNDGKRVSDFGCPGGRLRPGRQKGRRRHRLFRFPCRGPSAVSIRATDAA